MHTGIFFYVEEFLNGRRLSNLYGYLVKHDSYEDVEDGVDVGLQADGQPLEHGVYGEYCEKQYRTQVRRRLWLYRLRQTVQRTGRFLYLVCLKHSLAF